MGVYDPAHKGTFVCLCGEVSDSQEAYAAHYEAESRSAKTGLELKAVLDRHTVDITCACSMTFQSPFRFHLHQEGKLEAFDMQLKAKEDTP